MQLHSPDARRVSDALNRFRRFFINEHAHAQDSLRQLLDDAPRFQRLNKSHAATIEVEAQGIRASLQRAPRINQIRNAANFYEHLKKEGVGCGV
jgi:hypothetical protein